MRIPAFIVAGDSASWLENPFTDGVGASVDSAHYTLRYSFRGPTPGAELNLDGTASGSGWQLDLTTAQSAALNTGAAAVRWYWQAYALKTGARLTVGDGVLTVKPNLQALSNAVFDGRSQAEKILATIETAIESRATGDFVTEYTIGSRSLKKAPMTELLELRSRYRTIVSRERKAQSIKNGLGNPTHIGVRFRPN